MRHIPNFITSLNLISGFTAVILASKGDLFNSIMAYTCCNDFRFP